MLLTQKKSSQLAWFHSTSIFRSLYFCFVLTVFLTQVGIRQMLTWLPTWNAKSLHHVSTFCQSHFSCNFKSSKLSKHNQRKIPILKQIHAYHIFQEILMIFSYIYENIMLYSLSLANYKQMRKCNDLYWSPLFVCFFSVDIRSNHLESIWW